MLWVIIFICGFVLGILFIGGIMHAAASADSQMEQFFKAPEDAGYEVTKTRDRHTDGGVVPITSEPVAQNFEAQRAESDDWGHSSMKVDCASSPISETPLPVNATFNPMNAFPGGRWG